MAGPLGLQLSVLPLGYTLNMDNVEITSCLAESSVKISFLAVSAKFHGTAAKDSQDLTSQSSSQNGNICFLVVFVYDSGGSS